MYRLVNKWRRSSLLKMKKQRKRRVLSEEALLDVWPGLAEPSRKPLRWFPQEVGVSVSMAPVQVAQKYAAHAVIQKYCCLNTQDVDCLWTVRFCNWFCEAMCSGSVDLLVTYLQTKQGFT
jgi:hypothetical protein